MSYNTNSGISKLGAVLTERAQAVRDMNPPILDFGAIQSDYSLKTNTYTRPIPKGEYSVCRHLIPVQEGDRVLVAWVQNEAVAVDVITKS